MIRIVRKFAILFAVLTAQLYTAAAYYAWSLPDSYYTADSSTLELDTALHIAAVPAEHTVQAAADTAPASERISLRLFGLIPVKEVEVQQIETPLLVPCGQPFGIKLRMDGALVVGMSDVETAEGSRCPAQEAGIQTGDLIQSVNRQSVTTNQELQAAISASKGSAVTITFSREEDIYTCTLTPAFAEKDGCYEAGVWVRDSSAGIGTITFYEPESGSFGGLGHPVCDADTGGILPLGSGEAGAVTISRAVRGTPGNAGMLQGSFTKEPPLGELLCNNRCGVFGTLYRCPSPEDAVPMGLKQEIETGSAQILCTVSGDTPRKYDIVIEKIDYTGTDNTRNMTVCITDPALLEATGGIVQGMSGSPILQNGRLVGAVTHVFLDDPTRGYAIFCENMVRYGLCGS